MEKEYAVHAVLREKMSATNIGAGIAIPHANAKLIKQSAIAIATLKEPLDWGSEKVSLVFMLAVKHEDQNMTKQLFQELSSLSEATGLHPKADERNKCDEVLILFGLLKAGR